MGDDRTEHCIKRLIIRGDIKKTVKLKGFKLNGIIVKFYTINFVTKTHSLICKFLLLNKNIGQAHHKLTSKKKIRVENKTFEMRMQIYFEEPAVEKSDSEKVQ